MTMSDKQALVDAATRIAADTAVFASLLKDVLLPDKQPDVPAVEQPKSPTKVYTYEEARAVLAEKARTGFRAEVKAILTNHGVNQLSDVKDPEELAAIVAEVEEIMVG